MMSVLPTPSEGSKTPITIMKSSEPWWVLKDVCEGLKLSNSRRVLNAWKKMKRV
jgi:prophage antirepressor-like protein